MARKGDSKAVPPLNVNFRADRDLVHRYREVVRRRDERTVSQALRIHMTKVVNDARSKGELEDVAA